MITACECICAVVCTFVCVHTGIAFTSPSLAMHPPPRRYPPLTMPHTRGNRLHNPFFISNLYFVWIFFRGARRGLHVCSAPEWRARALRCAHSYK